MVDTILNIGSWLMNHWLVITCIGLGAGGMKLLFNWLNNTDNIIG